MSTVILAGAIPAVSLLAVILSVLGWAIVTGNRETANRIGRERMPTNARRPLPTQTAVAHHAL